MAFIWFSCTYYPKNEWDFQNTKIQKKKRCTSGGLRENLRGIKKKFVICFSSIQQRFCYHSTTTKIQKLKQAPVAVHTGKPIKGH